MTEATVLQHKERNYGVDLLRIVSMVMVSAIHVFGHSGILIEDKITVRGQLAWFFYIFCFCAVNCYALISGYVGITSKFKISNLVYLWLQVVFLSLLTTLVTRFVMPGTVGLKDFLVAVLPVTFSKYWYFTAYFALFLFMPFLNFLLNRFSNRGMGLLLLAITVLFTGLSTIREDVFNLDNGYSVVWLVLLYLIGGYIKKNNLLGKVQTWKLRVALIGIVAFTWLSKLVISLVTLKVFDKIKFSGLLIGYTSPTILAIAVLFLCIFSRKSFSKKPLFISFVAPLTFGIYITQMDSPFIWKTIMDKTEIFTELNPMISLLAVLLATVAVFLVCGLADLCRLGLFTLLRVKKHLIRAENGIRNKMSKLFEPKEENAKDKR